MPVVPRLVPEEVLLGGVNRISPIAYLKVLRAPGDMKSHEIPILETSQYLSPFLHNVPDTWVRHLRRKALRSLRNPYPEREPGNRKKIGRSTAHRLRTWTQKIRFHSPEFMETIADDDLEKSVKRELQKRGESVSEMMKKDWAIDRNGEMGEDFGWHPSHWFDIRLQLREEKKVREQAATIAHKSEATPNQPYEFTLCDDSDNEYQPIISKNIRKSSLVTRNRSNGPGSIESESPSSCDDNSIWQEFSRAEIDMIPLNASDDESLSPNRYLLDSGKLVIPATDNPAEESKPWMRYGPTIAQARHNKFISDLRMARSEVFPVDFRWQRPPMHYIRCEEFKNKARSGKCDLPYIISLFVKMAEQGLTTPSSEGDYVYSSPPSTVDGACTVIFSDSMQKIVEMIGASHSPPHMTAQKFLTSVVNRIRREPEYIQLKRQSRPYYNLKFKHDYMVSSMVCGSEDYKSKAAVKAYFEKEARGVRYEVGLQEKRMYECFDTCRYIMLAKYSSDQSRGELGIAWQTWRNRFIGVKKKFYETHKHVAQYRVVRDWVGLC